MITFCFWKSKMPKRPKNYLPPPSYLRSNIIDLPEISSPTEITLQPIENRRELLLSMLDLSTFKPPDETPEE
jgi:hypothetical protein